MFWHSEPFVMANGTKGDHPLTDIFHKIPIDARGAASGQMAY